MATLGQALLFAAVIVIIIIVVASAARDSTAWGHLEYWKTHYAEGPDQVYDRSAGGFDEAAALALRRAEDAAAPDHFRAAMIIFRNVVSQDHRADGAAAPEARQIRDEMFGRAREHFGAALTAVPVAAEEAARAARRGGARPAEGVHPLGEIPGAPGAAFVADMAFEFAVTGLNTFIANNLFPARPGAPPAVDAELFAGAAGLRDDAISARQAVAARVAAAQAAAAPGAVAAAYLDLSQRNTDDSQNSHDPSVNASKRAVIDRLRGDQGALDRLPTLDQISAEIAARGGDFSRDPRTNAARPVLTKRADDAVQRARRKEQSSSATASDEEVLRRVWARADDPRNAASHDLLRQAAFDALVDCWGRGIGEDHLVCVDGRIGRLVGSLCWLDCDERNWDVRRLEQHKNEIFVQAAAEIRAAAEEAAASGDADPLRAIGLAYLATTPAELAAAGETDPAREEEWAAATRARVARVVDAYVAGKAVPSHAVEGIKREACAAI